MAQTLDIEIDQGSDFLRILEFKNEANVAINLTGKTFRAQARSKFSDTDPAFTFTFTLQDQVTDTGKVHWILLAANSSAVSIDSKTKFFYDVEMVEGSSVERILEGVVTLKPEVTK